MKLDLHTHCHEAVFGLLSDEAAAVEIVSTIKAKGLDGIAITDHLETRWAKKMKRMIEEMFPHEVVIIPGQEVQRGSFHIVELFLSDDVTFRFMPHPPSGSPWEQSINEDIHGIEIDNPHWILDKEHIQRVAAERDLIMLTNSDAHSLEMIGINFNEVKLEDLISRAKRNGIRQGINRL